MTDSIRTREQRARRAADRQGLTLHKSRRRDPRAIEYGTYWLMAGHDLVPHTRGLDLEGIERYLSGEEQ
jgi:hypothetical protein